MGREKAVKGLEHCKKYGSLGGNNCDGYYEYTDNLQEIIKANNHRKDCPYGQCRTGCVVTLIDDTIATLKEQEAVKHGEWITIWREDDPDTSSHARCSVCNMVSERPTGEYCKWCGAKMDLEGR